MQITPIKPMVYGRYNYSNYSFHGVYKPTFTSLGGTILIFFRVFQSMSIEPAVSWAELLVGAISLNPWDWEYWKYRWWIPVSMNWRYFSYAIKILSPCLISISDIPELYFIFFGTYLNTSSYVLAKHIFQIFPVSVILHQNQFSIIYDIFIICSLIYPLVN